MKINESDTENQIILGSEALVSVHFSGSAQLPRLLTSEGLLKEKRRQKQSRKEAIMTLMGKAVALLIIGPDFDGSLGGSATVFISLVNPVTLASYMKSSVPLKMSGRNLHCGNYYFASSFHNLSKLVFKFIDGT